MLWNVSRMAYLELIILLCSTMTLIASNCNAESENNIKNLNSSKTEPDWNLSNEGSSIRNEMSLKKVAKRQSSEKNGVTGQPGVDFPALATIPTTAFSCRGLKGGYYADLETNCQVFHICDNGRKISFLCPNGTIFQQSQSICDWWFKVDCSKSTELYERNDDESYNEERRQGELRKSKSNYQDSIEARGHRDYYDVRNISYDGKQNGRIKPYREPPQENRLQSNGDRIKSSRHFVSGNNFNRDSNAQRDGNRAFDRNEFQSSQSIISKGQYGQFIVNTEEGDVDRYSTISQEHYNAPKKVQNYHATNRNVNTQRDEKGALKRLKSKNSNKSNSTFVNLQKVTPSYTESTTFGVGNPSPIKESQQFAESAAFVGNRVNRFDENAGDNRRYYYQVYVNRESTTKSPIYEPTTETTWRLNSDDETSTQKNYLYSFTDTTFIPYETTTRYSTVTPSCNDETTTNPTINFDDRPIAESLQFANSNYGYRETLKNAAYPRNSYSDKSYQVNGNNEAVSSASNVNNFGTIPTTIRPYVTTNNYGESTGIPISSQQRYSTTYLPPSPTISVHSNSFDTVTAQPFIKSTTENRLDRTYGGSKLIDDDFSTVSPGYRQNLIGTTSEKPFRTTASYWQNTATDKDLSPYDRSFTYKQGKVMSTLGPYVPFTKNYAHSSTATSTLKPTPYSPTVPTYTTLQTPLKTLSTKSKYPTPSSFGKTKSSSGTRSSEREHALSMLHSLRNLENSVPSLSETLKGNGRPYDVSIPPVPSTLHSLALYFSTATENFDSNETTESSVGTTKHVERSETSKSGATSVQVPVSLLTQHTLNSYVELFKLNDAVENNNATTNDRLDENDAYEEDYDEDLELQQSGGSLDDLRKSNSSRLRELAQVFTRALSAYLLDPRTFKKVLTEIRPTEPSRSSESTDEWRTTTSNPVTDDPTSSIDEKDEVLDFSDNGNDVRHKLTTIYPTTFESSTIAAQDNLYDILSTVPSNYYTTPKFIDVTFAQTSRSFSQNPVTVSYFENSVSPTEESPFEENSTPYNRNTESERGNVRIIGANNRLKFGDKEKQNRVGGFQNNTVTDSYEKEKSFVVTPVNDNYIVSPTPSSPSMFVPMVNYNWSKKSLDNKLEHRSTSPIFGEKRKNTGSVSLKPASYSSTPVTWHNIDPTTYRSISHHKSALTRSKSPGISVSTSRSNYVKYLNNSNPIVEENIGTTEGSTTVTDVTDSTISTTNSVDTTPCADKDYTEPTESTNGKEESKGSSNDLWTSSPEVTHLWETSVFVDPRKINHGLESDQGTTVSSGMYSNDGSEYENTRSFGEDTSDDSGESFMEDEYLSSFSQRLSRDKDSPTTFSLFPTSFTAENTITPKPSITTHSSIIATVISSISSAKTLPENDLVPSFTPQTIVTKNQVNDTENEIAKNLFGKLNASSSNKLMRVMKQADKNETVRQLVLLLVRHCGNPLNKTMEREKDELLNVLLRLPVNEFSSKESKNIVAEIDRLSLPSVPSIGSPVSSSSKSLITEPPVTTFRNRKNRKFRTTTENSTNAVKRLEKGGKSSNRNNSLETDDAIASDGRALELLRSLYTIATKWG